MTQKKLSEILHGTGCPVNEGVSSLRNTMKFPRIDYWEILWEDVMASGNEYDQKITWQISFYADKPRNPKLVELKKKLNELGYRIWHSYFSITTDGEYTDESVRD